MTLKQKKDSKSNRIKKKDESMTFLIIKIGCFSCKSTVMYIHKSEYLRLNIYEALSAVDLQLAGDYRHGIKKNK